MPQELETIEVPTKEGLKHILFALRSEMLGVPKNDVIAVSQVAEKAWVAFTVYVQVAAGRALTTGRAMRNAARMLAQDDRELESIWSKAALLHVFHYHPFVESTDELEYFLQAIRDVQRGLKRRMATLADDA
jgi:hypothetical protein